MTGTCITIPTLETERLRLRAPEFRDFESFAAFRASPRAVHVGGPHDRDQAFNQLCALIGHWQLRGYGRWIVADRETDEALGTTGPYYPEGWYAPEIAWSVFDRAEGRGIAYEAAQAARAYAYDVLGWTTVVSLVTPENTRSAALAQRMGCVRDGTFEHESIGPLHIWRHPSAEALA